MSIDEYRFTCRGHRNIRATHKTTLEFTKDPEVTLKGDCIVGVAADYDLAALKSFLKGKERITITMTAGGISDSVICMVNPAFSSDKEIVIRMGTFTSVRTLGVDADKGSAMLRRDLIRSIQRESKSVISIQ